jgi:DNA-binding NarL/FixJ family response regulator
VVTAATVDEAQELLASRNDWSAFLFDLRFGPSDLEGGIHLLAAARQRFASTPAFLVTGFMDPNVVLRAAALDARCWPKSLGREHFAQIAKILERERERPRTSAPPATTNTIPPPPGFAEHLDALMERRERDWSLTSAQRDLFRAIVKGGMTIAEYCEHTGKSPSTVRKHTAELLNKSGEDTLDRLARRTLDHAIHGRG